MKQLDAMIRDFDKALRAVAGVATSSRESPAQALSDDALPEAERRHSAGLMRVNHVGEVCAQALYDAQGRFSRRAELKVQFEEAGREEQDHLAWTAQRLQELGSRPSLLNPMWYAGAYTVGAIAARAGDAHSLGFVVETERQVEAHLAGHLRDLPEQDLKSRVIVDQMRTDEIAHGAAAQTLGAADTPAPIRAVMKIMAKIMTRTAYYI
jgi:3-demethoxyubiquinol 3-hydroxylase